MAITLDVRRDLAGRCRSRRTRSTVFTPAAPTEWRPRTVRDPRTDPAEYFTEDGAWEFAADAIEGGVKIEVIELDRPPGKKGYVFFLPGCEAGQAIYVKLQLRSHDVLGRSFHLSITQKTS